MSTAVQFSPTFVSSRLGMKSSLVRLMQRVCLARQIYCRRASVDRSGAVKRDVAQGGGACQRPVGPIGRASALLTLLLSCFMYACVCICIIKSMLVMMSACANAMCDSLGSLCKT